MTPSREGQNASAADLAATNTRVNTGTKPVAGAQAFDFAALDAYLGRHLAGYRGPLQVEQFRGGQSNPTFKLITPDCTYVMRSKPAPVARLLPSAHAIEREFRVMRALATSDVPVPRMDLLVQDESVIGRAFYIMGFVEGRVLWEPSLPGMTASERTAIYDEMNRVIAALHSVRIEKAGLSDYGRPGNYFERQITRWTSQYRASSTGANEAMERLIAWLPAHIPAGARDEAGHTIVHGDYRLDNLVFHPQEPRVLAVLDWELSTLGHPLADLSYHCMAWHIPPALFRGIGGLDLEALGIPAERDYVKRYCERTARTSPDAVLADWNFYLAYNLFRLSAIAQGIARRVIDGTAAGEQGPAIGAAAVPLAQLGWQMASEPGSV